VAAAVAALSLVGRPAAGHPRAAGSSAAASSSLAASHAAASQTPSASPDRSSSAHASAHASASRTPKAGGRTTQAGPGTAAGGPAAPGILTSVSSSYAPDGGYVYVAYQGGTDASATVSGQVTNAAGGEVARLYAQQFPFTSPPALASSAALDPSGSSAGYTFTVTPALATRYTVEVFRDSAAAAPLATSATSTVYVVMSQPGNNTWKCSGTQCQSDETVDVLVPPSALSAQMSEKIYTFFAINYGTGTVPEPETLQLGAGDPSVSAPEQISADEYQFSLVFSFSSDNEKWSDHYRHCTISLEAQDGIGLPGGGDYGCGSQTIPGTLPYIG